MVARFSLEGRDEDEGDGWGADDIVEVGKEKSIISRSGMDVVVLAACPLFVAEGFEVVVEGDVARSAFASLSALVAGLRVAVGGVIEWAAQRQRDDGVRRCGAGTRDAPPSSSFSSFSCLRRFARLHSPAPNTSTLLSPLLSHVLALTAAPFGFGVALAMYLLI